MGDRCTGGCCRFMLIYDSPEQLRAKGGEAVIIAGILECIGRHDPGTVDSRGQAYYATQYRYTCTKLGPDGNCTIYMQRPNMCLNFPYGGRCNFDGCQWDAALDGSHKPPRHLTVFQPEEDEQLRRALH